MTDECLFLPLFSVDGQMNGSGRPSEVGNRLHCKLSDSLPNRSAGLKVLLSLFVRRPGKPITVLSLMADSPL